MKIYNYCDLFNEYSGSSEAEESPLEPGEFIIPANATTIAPPKKKDGYATVFKDGKWLRVKDNRGVAIYDKENQTAYTHKTLDPIGSKYTLLSPPSIHHKFNGSAWELDVNFHKAELSRAARIQRDQLLSACDWTQVSDSPQFGNDAWRGYRQDLREITSQPGFPEMIDWPVAPNI